MSHGNEEVHKIYVNPNGTAVVKCPGCLTGKTVPADRFRGSKHILKVKCRCGNLFWIELEFRKFYRKHTSLSGSYFLLPEKIHRGRMLVLNISKGGVGLQIIGSHRLSPGQELMISFNLDDSQGSLLDRRVVVKLVNRNYIGCQFLGDVSHDKTLGFYLMA